VSESNFKDELEEVWVPKDVSELEALLLTIKFKNTFIALHLVS